MVMVTSFSKDLIRLTNLYATILKLMSILLTNIVSHDNKNVFLVSMLILRKGFSNN